MNRDEQTLQKQIVEYLRANRVFVFSVPNGVNVASPRTRVELQRMGLTAGVADLIIIMRDGKYAAIELKTESGRQSPAQKEFEHKVLSMGGQYKIWRSIKCAENWLKSNKINL